MRYYYGDYMPLRILDETEFWKRQEAEHVVVILEIAENLESGFVEALTDLQRMFRDTEAETVRYMEALNRFHGKPTPGLYSEIMYLVREAQRESEEFIALLVQILNESQAVSGNQVAQTVINHIRRESEYYVGIVDTFLELGERQ